MNNNSFEELEIKKLSTIKNVSSHNSANLKRIYSKKSMKSLKKQRTNSIQRNHVNANSHALQSLSDAALKVQNLLSDFLVNADKEDKEIFHIDDELERIKNNKIENSVGLFNMVNKNEENENNDDNIYSRKFKSNERTDNFHFGKGMEKGIGKNGKRKSVVILSSFPNNNELENGHNIRQTKTLSLMKKIGKKKTISLNENENTKSKNKAYSKKKTKVSFNRTSNNNYKKKLSRKGTNKSQESFDISFEENNEHNLGEGNRKNVLKKQLSFANLGKKILGRKSYISLLNKFELNKNNKNESLNESADNIKNESMEKENNNHSCLRNFKTIQSFGKYKLNKNKKTYQGINESSKSHNNIYDKNDIRNYFSLNKKDFEKFSDLCNNLRANITMKGSEKDKDENIFEIEKKKTFSNNKIMKKLSLMNPPLETEKEENEEKNKTNTNENENELNLNESDVEDTNEFIKEYHFRRLILKNGLVYDSLSDEESNEEIEGDIYFNPTGSFIFYYDTLIFFLSIYAIIFPPLQLAFNFNPVPKLSSKSVLMDFFIDIVFIIDFFLGFFTAFLDFEETLISNYKSIVIHYLFGWFTFDLISGIPINSIFIIIQYKIIKGSLILSYVDYSWKVYQILRLLRLIKLLKTFSQNSFANSIQEFVNEHEIIEKWFTLFLYLVSFFASVHLLSCIFIFLAQLEFPNWVYTYNFQFNYDKIHIYLAAFYYICATVFTVGYGDINSVSSYEKFYNLILLVFGMVVYSYIISALSNYVQSVDNKTLEYKNKLSILEQIRVSYDKLPQTLFDKINKFLLYRLHNEKKDKNDIMENIPLTVKNNLIMEMYKGVINNFIFFKNFESTDFIIKVILALKPIQASRNERLVNEGDYIEEIIFVKRGVLSLEIPLPIIMNQKSMKKTETIQKRKTSKFNNLLSNETKEKDEDIPKQIEEKTLKAINDGDLKSLELQYFKIIEIRRNEHFGDILMFLNKRSPLSVKVKSKFCELFLLQKTDAVEISMSFPTIWRKIIKKSLFNMEQIERLIHKTLKFFFFHHEGNKKNPENLYYYMKNGVKNNNFNHSTTIMNSLNNSEFYELKSIPSELSEYEEDEEEEEEEGEEYEDEEEEEETEENNEENNQEGNFRKIKESHIQTVIKEVDETCNDDDENSKSKEENQNNISSKSKKSENKSDDSSLYEENKNKSKSNDENTISVKSKISKSEFDSKSSSFDGTSVNTMRINIKNDIIDVSDNDSNDDKEKDKKTFVSSSYNNRTYHYSLEEINNEAMPFEESLNINENETLVSNLIPNSMKIQNNYYDNNRNFIFDESLRKNNSLSTNLIHNSTTSNKYKSDNEKSENEENENKYQNNLYNYSSFEFLSIQTNEEFLIEKKQKEEIEKLSSKSEKEEKEEREENEEKEEKEEKEENEEKEEKEEKSEIKEKNEKKEKGEKEDLNIGRVRTSPLKLNMQNKLKNNDKNKTNIKNTIRINRDSIKKTSTNIKKVYSNSMTDTYLKDNLEGPKRISISQLINSQKNTKRKRKKSSHQLKNDFSKKFSNGSIGMFRKTLNAEDNKDDEHNKGENNDKKDVLDVIINNIEKNSQNLTNPEMFYSKYFHAMIDKAENKNDNKSTKDLNSRLQKIAKLAKFLKTPNKNDQMNKEIELSPSNKELLTNHENSSVNKELSSLKEFSTRDLKSLNKERSPSNKISEKNN